MTRSWTVAMLGFGLLFGVSLAAGSKAQEPKPLQQTDIDRLVRRLGDSSFQIREMAMKQLLELGEQALPTLWLAQSHHGEEEVRRRAKLLVETIELRLSPRTTVNGLEFMLIVDKEWRAPETPTGHAPWNENRIDLTLRIKNMRDHVIKVAHSPVDVVLRNGDGNEIMGVGFSAPVPRTYGTLPKDGSLKIVFQAHIRATRDGLVFVARDWARGVWVFQGLSKGRYAIGLAYSHTEEPLEHDKTAIWIGKVKTPLQSITIR